MNEKEKTRWIVLLSQLDFNEKDYDKLFQYIKIHSEHEIKANLATGKPIDTTLPLALRVFLDLGDLEHVHIAEEPEIKDIKETETGVKIISDTKVKTYTLKLSFDSDDFEMIPIDDIEDCMAHEMIKETTNLLKKRLTEGELYIYKLFTNLVTKEKSIIINHFFYVE